MGKTKPTTKGDKEEGLTLQQEEFCKLYTSGDKDYRSNATQSYIRAYNIQVYDEKGVFNKAQYSVAGVGGADNLKKPKIKNRIKELLDINFSDETIDNELAFVIKQNNELPAKVSAIKEANRLKARVIEKPGDINVYNFSGMTAKELEEHRQKIISGK